MLCGEWRCVITLIVSTALATNPKAFIFGEDVKAHGVL